MKNSSDTWDRKVLETMRARSEGHVASLLQRGAEAAVLYHEITNTVQAHKDIPVIFLGDLNDDEYSIYIEALTNREKVYEIDDIGFLILLIWPQILVDKKGYQPFIIKVLVAYWTIFLYPIH